MTGFLNDVRKRVPELDARAGSSLLDVVTVFGDTADRVGEWALQEFANEHSKPVVIIGASKFHANRIYWNA